MKAVAFQTKERCIWQENGGYLAGKWGQENLSDCHFPAPIFLPEPITPIYYPLNFERLCIGELRPTSFHALVSAVQHGSKALSGIKPPTGFLNKYFEHRLGAFCSRAKRAANSRQKQTPLVVHAMSKSYWLQVHEFCIGGD